MYLLRPNYCAIIPMNIGLKGLVYKYHKDKKISIKGM
jgi:hypothetical protein